MNDEQMVDEKIKERLTLFMLQFEAMVLLKKSIATKILTEEDWIKAYSTKSEIYNSINNIFQFIKHRKNTAEDKACDKCGGDVVEHRCHIGTTEERYYIYKFGKWRGPTSGVTAFYCEACGIELSTLKCECQVEKGGNDE